MNVENVENAEQEVERLTWENKLLSELIRLKEENKEILDKKLAKVAREMRVKKTMRWTRPENSFVHEVSDAGISLIKSFEALRLTAYCPVQGDVPTIGWGHTGRDVYPGLVITEAHAEELLNLDLAIAELCVSKHVKIALKQYQFDALCSLVFNVGTGAFIRSRLLDDVNSGNKVGMQEEWLDWDHFHGVELPGLKKRREEECRMFCGGMLNIS